MPWTIEQTIFTVEAYFRQKSIHAAQNCKKRTRHFLLSGHVNSKNNIFWGSTPPEHCLQGLLHSVKCTAWVAISKHGIIGPFWFEDENERSVTINTERYVQVLGKFWKALGRRRVFRLGAPVVPAGWCHSPLFKRIIGMATATFP